jgi:O-antigen ligase
MGRIYQYFGVLCVFAVSWYCWKQCAGLSFRRAILAAVTLTFIFIWVHYKSISAPIMVYGAIGLFAIPAIAYGLLYRYEVLLIAAAIYIPYSSMLPADFGGAQQALNGTNILLSALILGLVIGQKGEGPNYSRRTARTATTLISLFMILVAISFLRASIYFGAVYYTQMAADFKRYLDPMVLFLFFLWVIPDRGIIKIIFSVLLIVVVMAFFLGLLEWVNLGFATYSGFKRRIGSLNMQPNVFGAFIAYYACLFWGIFLTNQKTISGKLMLLPLLLGIRLLIPSNSRGAWISFPPAFIASTWYRSPLLCVVSVLLITMIFAINPGLVPDTIRYRFQDAASIEEREGIYAGVPTGLKVFGESQSVSMRTRYNLLDSGLKMWKSSIFFGYGYGTFSYRVREFSGGEVVGTAHNGWLNMLVEMGLVTVASLAAIFGIFFVSALRVYRREKDALLKGCALGYLGIIPAILVANVTGERFSHIDLMAVFWMLSACLIKLRAIHIAEQDDEYRLRAEG